MIIRAYLTNGDGITEESTIEHVYYFAVENRGTYMAISFITYAGYSAILYAERFTVERD